MSFEKTFQEDQAKKYDAKLEWSVREWMGSVFTQSPGDSKLTSALLDKNRSFHDLLKDGEILCKYVPSPSISFDRRCGN